MLKKKHSKGATQNLNLENNPKLKNYFVLCKQQKKSIPNMHEKSLKLNNHTFLKSKKHSMSKSKNLSTSPQQKCSKGPLEQTLKNIYEGKAMKENKKNFIQRKKMSLNSVVRKNEKKGFHKKPQKSLAFEAQEELRE